METKEIIIAHLNNQDLAFDMERILSMDFPIVISMEHDANLDSPFAIDIEDNSYFYANEAEYNSDYLNLYSMLRPLGYDFVNNDINGFTLYTTNEFNNTYETDLQPYVRT